MKRSRRIRGAVLGSVVVVVGVFLGGAAPTTAAWTDSEYAKASAQTGTVSNVGNLACHPRVLVTPFYFDWTAPTSGLAVDHYEWTITQSGLGTSPSGSTTSTSATPSLSLLQVSLSATFTVRAVTSYGWSSTGSSVNFVPVTSLIVTCL